MYWLNGPERCCSGSHALVPSCEWRSHTSVVAMPSPRMLFRVVPVGEDDSAVLGHLDRVVVGLHGGSARRHDGRPAPMASTVGRLGHHDLVDGRAEPVRPGHVDVAVCRVDGDVGQVVLGPDREAVVRDEELCGADR